MPQTNAGWEDVTPVASPYAKPGPYTTTLSPQDEASFQTWVKQKKIPFDPSPTADYDMRGYYKDNVVGKGGVGTKVSTFDGKPHFPDTYKTPYHKTFSNESRYALPTAPHWDGDRLIDKSGKVVADETPAASADGWEPVVPPPQATTTTSASAATPPSQDKRGFARSFGDATGITSIAPHDLLGILSPTIAASNAIQGLINEGKRVYGEAKAAYNSTDPVEIQRHGTAAVPFIGKALTEAGNQVDQGNYAGAAGNTAGAIATTLGPDLIEGAGKVGSKLPTNPKEAVFPTSTTETPAQIQARRLGKALGTDVKDLPNFLNAASDEAGTIVDYAKRNGIQINSTTDLANAAKRASRELQAHFDAKILNPNKNRVINVPPDYRGTKLNVEGSRATLEDVNKRINTINQELSPDYHRSSAVQTNAAQVSNEELIAEKNKLTSRLQEELSEATGIPVEDISHLRRKAGKLRDIGEEAAQAANRNTHRAGSGTPQAGAHSFSKEGIVTKAVQAVQGGPEIIGNRKVRAAVKDIQPQSYTPPQPGPPKPELFSLPIREDLLQKLATKAPLTEADLKELRRTPAGRKAILESMRSSR